MTRLRRWWITRRAYREMWGWPERLHRLNADHRADVAAGRCHEMAR